MINTRLHTSISNKEALSTTGYQGSWNVWGTHCGLYFDEFYNTAGGSLCMMGPFQPRECGSRLKWQSPDQPRLVSSKTHIGKHLLNVDITGVTYRNVSNSRTVPCGKTHLSRKTTQTSCIRGSRQNLQEAPRRLLCLSKCYCLHNHMEKRGL